MYRTVRRFSQANPSVRDPNFGEGGAGGGAGCGIASFELPRWDAGTFNAIVVPKGLAFQKTKGSSKKKE